MAVVGGSQIDVQSLVSQLVAAERAPRNRILQSREIQLTTRLSAVATLKGALSNFQSALDPLRKAATFDARTVTSANTDIFTATATSSAATGSYQIEVLDTAQAHQLRSKAYAGGSSDPVGTGTLTIGVGSSSFSVSISDDNKSLAKVAAAINAATDNKGVQATLVNGVDGARLVLTATKTGADSAIKVTQSGGNGGLADLVYDPNDVPATKLTQTVEAKNARISIAGIEATSSTNAFSDAIEGVTISVRKKPDTVGTKVGLTIDRNTASTVDAVRKFVIAYNSMQKELVAQRAFDPATKAAGALIGDPMLRGVESEIRSGLSAPITGLDGQFTTLASIGIRTTASGALELDETKLNAAIAAAPTIVSRIFSGDNGAAGRLHKLMDNKLAAGGTIDSKNKGLNTSLERLTTDKQALEARLATIQARLLKQFTALDTLLSGMQSTSSFLTQQLANLPKSGN